MEWGIDGMFVIITAGEKRAQSSLFLIFLSSTLSWHREPRLASSACHCPMGQNRPPTHLHQTGLAPEPQPIRKPCRAVGYMDAWVMWDTSQKKKGQTEVGEERKFIYNILIKPKKHTERKIKMVGDWCRDVPLGIFLSTPHSSSKNRPKSPGAVWQW